MATKKKTKETKEEIKETKEEIKETKEEIKETKKKTATKDNKEETKATEKKTGSKKEVKKNKEAVLVKEGRVNGGKRFIGGTSYKIENLGIGDLYVEGKEGYLRDGESCEVEVEEVSIYANSRPFYKVTVYA